MAGKGSDAAIGLRLPSAMVKRADALKSKISHKDPTTAALGGKVSRSTVLKLALAEGLAVLEKRYK